MNDLQKQWEQDVADYGDNAYLMWETLGELTNCWYTFCDNSHANQHFSGHDFFQERRRKESAALPLDLERAKAGDVVEWFNGISWINAEETPCFWKKIYGGIGDGYRMKFPPRINK